MHLEYVWVQTISSSESKNSWTRYLPKAIPTPLPQNHHQALDINNSLILPFEGGKPWRRRKIVLIPDLEVIIRECQEHTGHSSKRDKELLRVKLNFFFSGDGGRERGRGLETKLEPASGHYNNLLV